MRPGVRGNVLLNVCVSGVILAACGFAQAPEKQNADELSARELYYMEKPGNDKLPQLSATTVTQRTDAKPKPKRKAQSMTSATSNSQAKTARAGEDTAKAQSLSDKPPNISEQPQSSEHPHPAAAAIPVVDHLGLRYSLLLIDKNTNHAEPVDAERVFHNGDCLALELEPNRAGYLYVLAKSSRGDWDPLFPSPQIEGESEVVHGRAKQRIPQNYCFELDEHPGEEHLYLILSRDPEQVYDLHDALLKPDATAEPGKAAKLSTQLSADAAQFNKQASETVMQLASRGFKITRVSNSENGEAKYSVYVVPAAQEKKDTVFTDIRIKHQ